MEDIVEQLKDAVVGLTVDEIQSQLEDLPNVPVDKAPAMAAWLASLNA